MLSHSLLGGGNYKSWIYLCRMIWVCCRRSWLTVPMYFTSIVCLQHKDRHLIQYVCVYILLSINQMNWHVKSNSVFFKYMTKAQLLETHPPLWWLGYLESLSYSELSCLASSRRCCLMTMVMVIVGDQCDLKSCFSASQLLCNLSHGQQQPAGVTVRVLGGGI